MDLYGRFSATRALNLTRFRLWLHAPFTDGPLG
jgi:hypothetical protein